MISIEDFDRIMAANNIVGNIQAAFDNVVFLALSENHYVFRGNIRITSFSTQDTFDYTASVILRNEKPNTLTGENPILFQQTVRFGTIRDVVTGKPKVVEGSTLIFGEFEAPRTTGSLAAQDFLSSPTRGITGGGGGIGFIRRTPGITLGMILELNSLTEPLGVEEPVIIQEPIIEEIQPILVDEPITEGEPIIFEEPITEEIQPIILEAQQPISLKQLAVIGGVALLLI